MAHSSMLNILLRLFLEHYNSVFMYLKIVSAAVWILVRAEQFQ